MESTYDVTSWGMHGDYRLGFHIPIAARIHDDGRQRGPGEWEDGAMVAGGYLAPVLGSAEDPWADLLLAIPDGVDAMGSYRNGPAWEGSSRGPDFFGEEP